MGLFSVSANGARVQTANGPQSLLTEDKPLAKLDTTKIVSFQTISLLFNNEPPQPTVDNPTIDTQLYQFAHGYSYTPSIWMAWQNVLPTYPATPDVGDTATTYPGFGDDSASANIPTVGGTTQLSLLANVTYNDSVLGLINPVDAFLYVIVDNTNVTLYVRKTFYELTSDDTVLPVHIAGVTVNLRIYVFVEPATTLTY